MYQTLLFQVQSEQGLVGFKIWHLAGAGFGENLMNLFMDHKTIDEMQLMAYGAVS